MWKFSVRLAVALILPKFAVGQILRGKVTLADGAPPMQRVIIERLCQGGSLIQDALTGKRGEYSWRVPEDRTGIALQSPVRLSCRRVLAPSLQSFEPDGD